MSTLLGHQFQNVKIWVYHMWGDLVQLGVGSTVHARRQATSRGDTFRRWAWKTPQQLGSENNKTSRISQISSEVCVSMMSGWDRFIGRGTLLVMAVSGGALELKKWASASILIIKQNPNQEPSDLGLWAKCLQGPVWEGAGRELSAFDSHAISLLLKSLIC